MLINTNKQENRMKYYYRCTKRDGSVSEGHFPYIRRFAGKLLFGEEFTILGKWIDD